MKAAGIDIWKGKWVVVVLDDGRFEAAFVAPTIGAALPGLADAAAIGIDVPIGLPEPGQRRPADQMARAFVGPRWQSVFMTPSLDMLEAPSLAAANHRAAEEGRERMSAQVFGLRHAILEVRPMAVADTRVHEVHPEASFVRANADRPLMWSKTSWNGLNLRRRVLERHGIMLPDELPLAGAAGFADVVDAAAVAWSAMRIAAGTAQSMPAGAERIGAIWG
jgi:predicted RNase H-like nuclease